jgi:hypothetical protein
MHTGAGVEGLICLLALELPPVTDPQPSVFLNCFDRWTELQITLRLLTLSTWKL